MKMIDKAAVVAEIEKRIKEIDEIGTYLSPKGVLTNLLCYLNTLEVKEVEINKEISQFIDANFEKATIGHKLSLRRVAKHFFELGLNAQRKIGYVSNIDDSLKELGVVPSSKEAKIFKESYCAALDKFMAQKGE